MGTSCFYCGKTVNSKGYRCFHKFPKDPKQKELWLHHMGLEADFEISKESRLCSDHFLNNCFTKNNNDRMRLLSACVPTVFGRFHLKCLCCDNIKRRGSDKSFRKFPVKNEVLLKKWKEAIGIENLYPDERSLICDDHFKRTCFYLGANGYVGLKSNAVPTIFLKSSSEETDGSNKETDGLIKESEVTLSNASNENFSLTSKRNSENSILTIKNRKRSSAEELPDPKHLKLIEDEGSKSVIYEIDSLNNTDISHYQEEDNTTVEATASDTSIKYCDEERSYLLFCFILSLIVWLFAFVLPNLRTKISKSVDSKVIDNEAESPNISEKLSSQSVEKAPKVPSTLGRIDILKHDHHYSATPIDFKRRYHLVRRKLKKVRTLSKAQTQHIVRLKRKIAALSEIVSKLHLIRTGNKNRTSLNS
ncbi:THAP domain-containing protein 5-like isoform X2 [Belonocnema kinseyi]|uniref:THAP domain-containing protein 5-like isoform X2 n=1 Tax=Belonocnema kinseyi TaxID=2817044 RepID=UPI00143E03DD|nr:THAP domain-containing protein 5-like isoform X2 [Belonocnema kinseyi]